MKPVYKTIPILGLTLSLGMAQGGMQTTVTIQERIIEAFVGSDSVFSLKKKPEGVYIQGLGAVFKVSIGYQSSFPTVIYTPKVPGKTQVFTPLPEVVDSREDWEEVSALHSANVNRMVEAFKHYLADYGPALDLPEDEVILLKVAIQGLRSFDDGYRKFQLNTRGGDLKALRSGTQSRVGYLEKIVVSENGRSNPRDVVIMGNILETAFDPREGRGFSPYLDRDESWGTYLPGFGAMFFRKYSTADYYRLRIYTGELRKYSKELKKASEQLRNVKERLVEGTEKLEKVAELAKEAEERKGVTEEKARADLENKISDLIAAYAATLKSLKAEEQLVVAVKLSPDFESRGGGMLIFRLKKADIDKFRQPLDLRNRIEVIKL